VRHIAFLLILFALSGSVTGEIEYLTVVEIFEAINFLHAHAVSPLNHSAVSPFGPEADETRMPETFADLAKTILRCYHETTRFQHAEIVQMPWDQQSRYGGEKSAVIRIQHVGAASGAQYEMSVGLVSQQAQIRTKVLDDTSPVAWNAHCRLENWLTLGR
jgi:hypothetical protein